jgi:hypothetical protein
MSGRVSRTIPGPAQLLLKRSFASKSPGEYYRATAPIPEVKSWESGARMVKNTTVENKYMEHIRAVHDPSMHVKTIEDELKGTIGKALGKQGQKVLSFMHRIEEERQKYEDLREQQAPASKITACAIEHNSFRKQGIQARWELLVHRQAVGFITNNHKFVMDKFPIGDALSEEILGDGDDSEEKEPAPKPQQFTDQLEWWQNIGRWR